MKRCVGTLTKFLLVNEVAVVATTPIHAADKSISERNAEHTIVQEAFTMDAGAILTILAHTTGSISMSGDTEQLKIMAEDIKHNCMANSTNFAFMNRLIANGYPQAQLSQQYRTIPVLSEIISSTWYKGEVTCMVDITKRPNVVKATSAIKQQFGIELPIAFVNVPSVQLCVGSTMSRQNYIEAQLALDTADTLNANGITDREICILTGYVAQVHLMYKLQGQRKTKCHVECLTIDKSQGEEYSCIIWSVTGTEIGFHNPPRTLVATSRAKDSMIILGNRSDLECSKSRHLKSLREVQVQFTALEAYVSLDTDGITHVVPKFKSFEDKIHQKDKDADDQVANNEEEANTFDASNKSPEVGSELQGDPSKVSDAVFLEAAKIVCNRLKLDEQTADNAVELTSFIEEFVNTGRRRVDRGIQISRTIFHCHSLAALFMRKQKP